MKIKNSLRIISIFVVFLISFIPISFAVSVNPDTPSKTTITFDKLHEVDITVKKRMTEAMGEPIDFEEGDQAIITLTKIKEKQGEQEFIQFVDYSYESGPKTIQLVPGNYVINGQYILNKEVVIPGRVDTYCKGYGEDDPEQIASDFTTTAAGIVAGAAVASVVSGAVAGGLAGALTVTTVAATTTAAGVTTAAVTAPLASFAGIAAAIGPVGWVIIGIAAVAAIAATLVDCIGEKIPVNFEEISMNPAILGGVKGNITITDNLYSKESIKFYIFAIKDPLFIEDLNIISMLEELGATYPEYIRPKYE